LFRPINPLGNGRFGAFETNTHEANLEYLLGEWAKTCVKRDRTPCTRCNGYGHIRPRPGKEGDGRIGCEQCHGEGSFENRSTAA
jgi:hypothetical protein